MTHQTYYLCSTELFPTLILHCPSQTRFRFIISQVRIFILELGLECLICACTCTYICMYGVSAMNTSISSIMVCIQVYLSIYIHTKKNKSLSTTLQVYGHPTALLSETGIPPHITQNLQLAQLRFRLYPSPPTTIQHFLWCLWQPLLQAAPLDTPEDRMQNAIVQVDPPRRDPKSPMPHNVTLAKQNNKEKSYKKYLETQCSDQ